jgi:hypothetical protein
METIVNKGNNVNKYSYVKVIQQNYGQGWEDVSEYECNSVGMPKEIIHHEKVNGVSKPSISLLSHDLKEYRLMGYATRVIMRKILNDNK